MIPISTQLEQANEALAEILKEMITPTIDTAFRSYKAYGFYASRLALLGVKTTFLSGTPRNTRSRRSDHDEYLNEYALHLPGSKQSW